MSPLFVLRFVSTVALILAAANSFAQGALTPPGSPAPTMKTLQQIEPRTPIESLPYTISAPGSYYLTGDLTGVAGANGILVSASDVSIDLMGFTLRGVAGSFSGIAVSSNRSNLAVHNGVIRDWGQKGVNAVLASNAIFSRLHLFNNGFQGIDVGPSSAVLECVAENNQDEGFRTIFAGVTFMGCTAYGNGLTGLWAGSAGIVRNCVAHSNGGDGILALSSSLVENCTAYYNSDDGIDVDSGVVVSGCAAFYNVGDGIQIFADCLVIDNACDENGWGAGDGAGIHTTGTDNRIEGNNVTDNDRGIDVDSAGNLIIRNSAAGNLVPYDFVADNQYGEIVDRRLTVTPAVSGAIAPSTLTTTDPWANFAF